MFFFFGQPMCTEPTRLVKGNGNKNAEISEQGERKNELKKKKIIISIFKVIFYNNSIKFLKYPFFNKI